MPKRFMLVSTIAFSLAAAGTGRSLGEEKKPRAWGFIPRPWSAAPSHYEPLKPADIIASGRPAARVAQRPNRAKEAEIRALRSKLKQYAEAGQLPPLTDKESSILFPTSQDKPLAGEKEKAKSPPAEVDPAAASQKKKQPPAPAVLPLPAIPPMENAGQPKVKVKPSPAPSVPELLERIKQLESQIHVLKQSGAKVVPESSEWKNGWVEKGASCCENGEDQPGCTSSSSCTSSCGDSCGDGDCLSETVAPARESLPKDTVPGSPRSFLPGGKPGKSNAPNEALPLPNDPPRQAKKPRKRPFGAFDLRDLFKLF